MCVITFDTHKQYHKLPGCSFPLGDVSICQSTRHSHTRRWWISWDVNTSLSQCGYKFRDCLIHFNVSLVLSPFFRSQKYHSVAFLSISIPSLLCAAFNRVWKMKTKPWNEWNRAINSSCVLPSLAFFSIYKSSFMKHAEVHICANMTFIHHIHVTWSVHREREEMANGKKKRAIHEKFTNIFPFSTDTRLLSLIFNAFCWALDLWCCDSLVLRNDTQKKEERTLDWQERHKGRKKRRKTVEKMRQ